MTPKITRHSCGRPADYSLGFIDVETAVYFGKAEENNIRQPLLGGTPYYATPSHLFPNSVLAACFGDTSRILHFQDWQAVLVMIFKAVTGELLFDRTATHFADIKNRVMNAMRQAEALDPQLEEVSRIFWRSAAAEFRTKMKAAESALRFVEADIPQPAKALFAPGSETRHRIDQHHHSKADRRSELVFNCGKP